MLIVVAGLVVSVPIAISAVFFVWLSIDMNRVENRAEACEQLVPAVYDFRKQTGRFPNENEAASISPTLQEHCSYYNSGEQFSMGLTGGWINLQVYGFDSGTGSWHWD